MKKTIRLAARSPNEGVSHSGETTNPTKAASSTTSIAGYNPATICSLRLLPDRTAGPITNTHCKSAKASVTMPASTNAARRCRPPAWYTSSTSPAARKG